LETITSFFFSCQRQRSIKAASIDLANHDNLGCLAKTGSGTSEAARRNKKNQAVPRQKNRLTPDDVGE
jgi:hypothetical protein